MVGESKSRFKIRFMLGDETHRVAELVAALQSHQKMKHCPRIPTGDDLNREITRLDGSGQFWPNNRGTFTAVAIDECGESGKQRSNQSNIIGYLIYSQSNSIINGRQFYLNSFFIEEPYRRHGIGRKFIQFVKMHGELVGIRGFDVPFMNNNYIGQKFYKSYGSYLINEEYQILSIDCNSLCPKEEIHLPLPEFVTPRISSPSINLPMRA